MKKLKIGWLIPYSGIFKELRKDLQQGLDTAIKKEGAGVSIESFSEFIQSGSIKNTEEALKKLLLYNQVDLVVGVTGSKTAIALIPLLENHRTPALLLNLGADLPSRRLSSEYLFYNSLHLWKSQWAIGRWMQDIYKGEPSINLSAYESGYGLQDSFRAGASASGATTLKINLVRNISGPPDTMPLIRYIQEQRSPHIHALLSGKEGEQFLQLYQQHIGPNGVGVSVNPFMVEDDFDVSLPPGPELFNATTWTRSLNTPDNNIFIRAYTADWEESPNAFSMLAYEAGLVLATALEGNDQKISRASLTAALGQTHAVGPRGVFSVSTTPLRTTLPVYIRKPILSSHTGRPENTIITTSSGIDWDDPALLTEQPSITGWQNPYLCV